MLFEYAIVGGILYGLFYALLSVGLSLVFGVQRIVNLAHGDVVMLGAYGAWELYYAAHINPLWAVILVMPPAVGMGFLIYYGIGPRLKRAADPEILSLVLFFGISQVIEALATFGFGSNQRSVPASSLVSHPIHFLGQPYPAVWWIAGAVSVPVLAVFFWYLYRTTAGRSIRAVMVSEAETAAVGINVRRVSAVSLGIGFALAASAGVLSIFMLGGVNPTEGIDINLIGFAVIVIGSLGNPLGTVAGGLVYGVAYQLTQTYASSWAGIVPFVILLVIMLIKPNGLFGRATRYA